MKNKLQPFRWLIQLGLQFTQNKREKSPFRHNVGQQ